MNEISDKQRKMIDELRDEIIKSVRCFFEKNLESEEDLYEGEILHAVLSAHIGSLGVCMELCADTDEIKKRLFKFQSDLNKFINEWFILIGLI